jgi:prolyl-tRNA editing enzyme YbaK/EbsC (Cys-tRNA(Pro) deacylase)
LTTQTITETEMQTPEPLQPSHVQSVLDAHRLNIRIRYFETTTATSQQAADNIGCALGQIVKSIAFLVEDRPVLVLASGDQRVDDRRIAAHYGVGRKKVKVATPEQMITLYGYAPGSMPPIAHRTSDIDIFLDATLQRYEQVFAAGGAHNAIFGIALAQLAEITQGRFMDVVRVDSEPASAD